MCIRESTSPMKSAVPIERLDTKVCAEDFRDASVLSLDVGRVCWGNCHREARRPARM
jgi:hypothetical protein